MEEPEDTAYTVVLSALTGVLAAGVSFFLFDIAISELLVFLNINKINYENGGCNTIECLSIYIPCCITWLVAIVLGAFGGIAGVEIANKRQKSLNPWISAVIGGLVVALVAAVFVELVYYSIWS